MGITNDNGKLMGIKLDLTWQWEWEGMGLIRQVPSIYCHIRKEKKEMPSDIPSFPKFKKVSALFPRINSGVSFSNYPMVRAQ